MLKNSLFARIVACAAGVAMVLPALPVQAAPQATQEARQGVDVALADGALNGKLLNANGKPVEGATVSVSKNGKVVAKTVTAKDGSYTVAGLSSGTHTVGMADGQFPVRLWSQDAAPASAQKQLTIAQTAVRGQYALDNTGTLIIVGTAIVALTALGIAIDAHEDAHDKKKPASP